MYRFYDSEGNMVEPQKHYEYEMPDIVLAPDGKVYELDDNGACGDPECCGDREYYYKSTTEYTVKEVL